MEQFHKIIYTLISLFNRTFENDESITIISDMMYLKRFVSILTHLRIDKK